jgi:hypothetical protein
MILSIAALNQGLYLVVATSLLGSILSNLLLVLGEQLLGSRVSTRGRTPLMGCGGPGQTPRGSGGQTQAAADGQQWCGVVSGGVWGGIVRGVC